jgi:hypothetical protein
VRFAREYLAESPIDVVNAFLHEFLLYRCLVERHQHQRLQSVANVVIHQVDDAKLFAELPPDAAFIQIKDCSRDDAAGKVVCNALPYS